MSQLMPLPLTVSCFSKIQIGFTFWYRPIWVVPEKGPLNGCKRVYHAWYTPSVAPASTITSQVAANGQTDWERRLTDSHAKHEFCISCRPVADALYRCSAVAQVLTIHYTLYSTRRALRKQGSCLDKEIMQGTTPGARRRGRPHTHGLDGQHQDVDGTLRGRVDQNDRGQR